MTVEGFAGLIVEDAYKEMFKHGEPHYIVAGVTLNTMQSKSQMFDTLLEHPKFRDWAAYKIKQQYQVATK